MTQNHIRILRPKAVREKIGMGNTWLWEQVKNGTFPKPIAMGSRASGFIESEVDQWIADRIKSSRSDEACNAAA